MATARKTPARKASPPKASPHKAPAARKPVAHVPVVAPRADDPVGPAVAAPAKVKRVHGKFAMPEADYALIGELKALAKKNGQPVRKNELLRAGLRALRAMEALALRGAIAAVRSGEALASDKGAKKKKGK